jgi:hypothetical protein
MKHKVLSKADSKIKFGKAKELEYPKQLERKYHCSGSLKGCKSE